MSKTIIISNRLPVSVRHDKQKFTIEPSIGGLATGMQSFHEHNKSIWIGWNGVPSDKISTDQEAEITTTLRERFNYVSVSLDSGELDDYYYGFFK